MFLLQKVDDFFWHESFSSNKLSIEALIKELDRIVLEKSELNSQQNRFIRPFCHASESFDSILLFLISKEPEKRKRTCQKQWKTS